MQKSFIIAILAIAIVAFSALLPGKGPDGPQTLYRDQVAVLMYHHVHKTDTSSSTIKPELFREQLQFLKKQGFAFISLADFTGYLHGAAVPDNAVLVTFDDGYESFYKEAYPIVNELKVPAVNFVITETLNNPRSGGIPFLEQDEIAAMTAQSGGLIDFGCHTNSLHEKLPSGEAALVGREVKQDGLKETDEQYRQRIANDTSMCINQISSIVKKPVDFFAYPYGIYSDEASEVIHQGGIRYAFTIVGDMATRQSNPLRIPRINAGSPNISPQYLYAMIKQKIVAMPSKS